MAGRAEPAIAANAAWAAREKEDDARGSKPGGGWKTLDVVFRWPLASEPVPFVWGGMFVLEGSLGRGVGEGESLRIGEFEGDLKV